MAITDPYATAEQYRVTIKPDASDDGDELLTDDLTAISRYLDGRLGQFFSRDDQDVAIPVYVAWGYAGRHPGAFVDPNNTRPSLPPLVSVTSITWGTRPAVLAAELELWPLDAPLRPEPEPYRAIGRPNLASWPYSGKAIILGQRGWPAVPTGIRAATIQLCAILRLETPRATRRIPELGDAIETSPDAQRIVQRLLDQYKVHWFS